MTLGGEGTFGYVFTENDKLKMSQSKKEYIKNNSVYLINLQKASQNYWTIEKKEEMSMFKKEQIKNNPEITEKWRKTRGEWTIEQKKEHSRIVKEKFAENPKRANDISERMKIFAKTLEGKKRGHPQPFIVHLNGEYIGTYDYVPYAVDDILNKKMLINICEKSFGKSIRRVLSGERNHTKGFTFSYINNL
jgi:hypothetical protein